MSADTGTAQGVLGLGADVCSLKEPAANFGLTQTEYCLQRNQIGMRVMGTPWPISLRRRGELRGLADAI